MMLAIRFLAPTSLGSNFEVYSKQEPLNTKLTSKQYCSNKQY
jgi:hypothetical protein